MNVNSKGTASINISFSIQKIVYYTLTKYTLHIIVYLVDVLGKKKKLTLILSENWNRFSSYPKRMHTFF